MVHVVPVLDDACTGAPERISFLASARAAPSDAMLRAPFVMGYETFTSACCSVQASPTSTPCVRMPRVCPPWHIVQRIAQSEVAHLLLAVPGLCRVTHHAGKHRARPQVAGEAALDKACAQTHTPRAALAAAGAAARAARQGLLAVWQGSAGEGCHSSSTALPSRTPHQRAEHRYFGLLCTPSAVNQDTPHLCRCHRRRPCCAPRQHPRLLPCHLQQARHSTGAEEFRRLRVTSCAALLPRYCAAFCVPCQRAGQAKTVHGRCAAAAPAVGCADPQWPRRCVILYRSAMFTLCAMPQNLSSENLHAAASVFSDLSVHVQAAGPLDPLWTPLSDSGS